MRLMASAGFLVLVGMTAPLAGQEASVVEAAARRGDSLLAPWEGTTRPGCVTGVAWHGRVVYRHATGMANLETATPNSLETVFLGASLAKQVTAMAVLLLVRDGRLGLDVDVRPLLPELPDYLSPITVRQLLTHTSGLRDFFELLILARGRFEEDRITRADLLAMLARQHALNFPPGTAFGYSNTNYALLALLVERVSGRPFPLFADSALFAPLGMARTRFRDDFAALVPGRATGYARSGSTWRQSFANYDVVGPTNLFTTVDDLLRWAENLARPVVGDTGLVRQMMTKATLANGDSVGYGFGLGLWTDHGAPVAEHEGSDPGFRAFLGRYPAQELNVAVLCNTRSADAVRLGHQLASGYLGWPSGEAPPYPSLDSARVDTGQVAARAGVYFEPTGREILVLAWREGELRLGRRRLRPVGRDSFQLVGEPVLYTFGAGPRQGFTVSSLLPGRHPSRFEWRQGPAPVPVRLADYAGRYTSAELGATYVVKARDSVLELRTGTAEPLVARRAFGDTFTIGQLVVEFRQGGGRVRGFALSHPRARGIGFTACKPAECP